MKKEEYLNYIHSLEELTDIKSVMTNKIKERKEKYEFLLEECEKIKKDINDFQRIEEEANQKICAKEKSFKEGLDFPKNQNFKVLGKTILGYENLSNSLKIYYFDGSMKEVKASKKERHNLEKELLKEAIVQIRTLVERNHNSLTEKEAMYLKRWKQDFLPCLDLLEEVGASIWDIPEFDLLKMNHLNFYEYKKYMDRIKIEVRFLYRNKNYRRNY